MHVPISVRKKATLGLWNRSRLEAMSGLDKTGPLPTIGDCSVDVEIFEAGAVNCTTKRIGQLRLFGLIVRV